MDCLLKGINVRINHNEEETLIPDECSNYSYEKNNKRIRILIRKTKECSISGNMTLQPFDDLNIHFKFEILKNDVTIDGKKYTIAFNFHKHKNLEELIGFDVP
jgi:hypothetical protein